jgi:general secretion pathway protein G
MQATLERLKARREERGDEGGFTLIELLIVIVILAILAAIVVFAVSNLSSSSAQASCKADFQTVETAVEAYKAQEGAYPNANTGGTPAQTPGVAATDTNAVNALMHTQGSVGPWLRTNPTNTGHYQIVASVDGNGTVSVFKNTGASNGSASAAPTDAADATALGTSASNCSSVS